MDSGNSSSMQSSSGGGGDQEEYDSRADHQSFSAFFNQTNNNTTNIPGSTQLDSLIANYFNNTGWSPDQTLWQSATKPTDGSSSRQQPPQQAPISQEPVFFPNPNPLDHQQQQQQQQNMRVVVSNTTSPSCSVPTDKKNVNGLMPTRNPKKRSRVSRRAPTTVLTTDTSNFRAMVQEFTGNPSTPFTTLSSSSPFPRSRFDLFGSSSSSSSRPSSLPLRPFPHKPNPYLPPSSSNYHHNHLLNMNITNPFLNNQPPLTDHHQSHLCEKSSSRPLFDQSSLSLRTSNEFGHVETNFEGLHNMIVSSSSSSMNVTTTTQPTLNTVHHGDKTTSQGGNDLLRSINGEDRHTLQRSDASGSESNLAGVRNDQGMVELSWISSSD